MKIYIFITVIFCLTLMGCQKTEELIYKSSDGIYFNFEEEADRDSILYSFAFNPELGKDTIFLPVKISGNRIPVERTFRVEVDADGTTATESLHFQPLPDLYTLPADSGNIQIPFIIYNTDKILEETSVAINLSLVTTEDFNIDNPTLITSRIIFSNRLEKPVWWDLWAANLGSYSRTKHQLFLIGSGTIDLIDSYSRYLEIPKTLYDISTFITFMTNPFEWIGKNPEDGYLIEEQSDGDFHFFHVNKPEKIYIVRLNENLGEYFFLEEDGSFIIY